MARPKKQVTAPRPLGLSWLRDDYRARIRVWRNDWPGDVFEQLTEEEFKQLESVCKRFAIALTEHIDDD